MQKPSSTQIRSRAMMFAAVRVIVDIGISETFLPLFFICFLFVFFARGDLLLDVMSSMFTQHDHAWWQCLCETLRALNSNGLK